MSPKDEAERVKRLLGARISRRRDKFGPSQEDLAHLAKVDRSHMSSIETDKTEPGIGTLARIAGALRMPSRQLLEDLAWIPSESGPGHLEQGDP